MLPPAFFRREYARLVGVLVCRFGAHRLAMAEDSVQAALAAAVSSWAKDGLPDEPKAWLTTVAKRNMIDTLRRQSAQARALEQLAEEPAPEPSSTDDAAQAQLSMLCLCCDPSVGPRSQMVLALKVVCGFGIEEIALRLFLSPASVQKRLERARSALAKRWQQDLGSGLQDRFDSLSLSQLAQRGPGVLRLMYLLFNEGYATLQGPAPLRRELCEEALGLAQAWSSHPAGQQGASYALVAMMHLHLARFDARLDDSGKLVLLEDQDRSKWDRRAIAKGVAALERSAIGEDFSRYHAEAAIAAQHCLAPSYDQTRWEEIDEMYQILYKLIPSPIYLLSRAICQAQLQGPQRGLDLMDSLEVPDWLKDYYLWDATLGELHRRAGHAEQAQRLLSAALAKAPKGHQDKELIAARLASLTPSDGPSDKA